MEITSNKHKKVESEIFPIKKIKFETDFRKQFELDLRISKLDPLNMDSLFSSNFNDINNNSDVDQLVKIAVNYGNIAQEKLILNAIDQDLALATIRDLGMIASSLTKENIEIKKIRPLHDSMLALSEYTGEVARDTVFSYGTRNPNNDRIRTFTGILEEHVFISSFREGMKDLSISIEAISKTLDLPINDPIYSSNIDKAKESFEAMVDAIKTVHQEVPPHIFSSRLRPYFNPYFIDNKKLLAPGGAGMPVTIIDYLLWSSNFTDESYISYLYENISYLPYSYKYLFDENKGTNNLYDKFITDYQWFGNDENVQKSLNSLIGLFNVLIRFRSPHKKVADENFKIRDGEAVGSGGHKPTVLQQLIDETFDRYKVLKSLNK